MQNKVTYILVAAVFLLLGFLSGLLVERTVFGGSGDMAFGDGKTLDLRLAGIEDTLNEVKETSAHADELITQAVKPPPPKKLDPDMKYEFDLSVSPWKGAENPKVTIIEFSDFQCPYCQRMAGVLDELLEQHPDDIRLYFKNRLIHQSALPAHEAAFAAYAQGKFWEMYDRLFIDIKRQSDEDIELYAVELGLDMEEFKAAMAEHKFQGLVKKDDDEARNSMINSTPSVFINGYYQTNPSPDLIRQAVEAAVKGGG